ncbi:hypothetical protein FOZ62_016985, partial [Perkinsus olseni]
GEAASPHQSLRDVISAGLEAIVSRLEGLPAGTDLPASLPLLTAMLPLRVVEVLGNVSESYSASESSSFSPKSSSGCRTEVYSTLKRVVSIDECLPFKESLVTAVRERQRLRVGDKSRLVLQRRETVLEGRGVVPFFVGGGVRFLREPRAVEPGDDVTEKLRE